MNEEALALAHWGAVAPKRKIETRCILVQNTLVRCAIAACDGDLITLHAIEFSVVFFLVEAA